MKKRISKYFFSIGILLVIAGTLSAQTKRTKGLRLGVDISRFALYYLQPEREGLEFSGDFEIKRDFYLVGEYGTEFIKLDKNNFNYQSEGYFFRAGFDKNFASSENPDEYEMVFGGFRYGYATQKHLMNAVNIQDPYWGGLDRTHYPEKQSSTHWIEVVAGIRAELFTNFFIGWSVRGRIRLAHTSYDMITPYNVPGYGNGSKKSNLGFNFSLFYRIPIYKQTVDYKKVKI